MNFMQLSFHELDQPLTNPLFDFYSFKEINKQKKIKHEIRKKKQPKKFKGVEYLYEIKIDSRGYKKRKRKNMIEVIIKESTNQIR